jgi:hypothetical protein
MPVAPQPVAHAASIQRHANGTAFQLPPNLANFNRNPGQPLPDAVRQQMESAFGTDFSSVRIHIGPEANAIGAVAFTHGSSIHFAPGQYDPHSPRGQQLLGHELAHVVQQRTGRVRNPFGAGVAVVQDLALEQEADRLGQRAAAHRGHVQAKMMPGSIGPARIAQPKGAVRLGGPGSVRLPGQGVVQRAVLRWNSTRRLWMRAEGTVARYAAPRDGAFNGERYNDYHRTFVAATFTWNEDNARWEYHGEPTGLNPSDGRFHGQTWDYSNGTYSVGAILTWSAARNRWEYNGRNARGAYGTIAGTRLVGEYDQQTYNTRNNTVSKRTVMVHPGYATGDMFGVAAALVLKPDLHVVVTDDASGDPTIKGADIERFLKQSLPADQQFRVTRVTVTSVRHRTGPDNRLIAAATTGAKGKVEGVNFGTKFLAKGTYDDAKRNAVRAAWQVNDSVDGAIGAWLDHKGIPKTGTSLVILWSRFSGKKGDVHVEHDTSFTGMQQLAKEARKTNEVVIITGDKPIKATSRGKFTAIATGLNTDAKNLGRGRIFDIAAFWETTDPTEKGLLAAWGGNTRMGQFKLYDYFKRKFSTVKHLGFRSGNLEAYALMGHTVRYMEEPNSIGGSRMAQWHGKGMGYERITVTHPPTRSGQHTRLAMDAFGTSKISHDVLHPTWVTGVRTTPKPDVSAYSKGFVKSDIKEKVRPYLTTPTAV